VDEVPLPPLNWKPTETEKFSKIMFKDYSLRLPEAVGLPSMIIGGALPRPDRGDNLSLVQGVKKRLLNARPEIDTLRLNRLKDFVSRWLRENMIPLERTDVLQPEEWIDQCNQPESRRNEYREALIRFRNGEINKKSLRKIKTFCKAESYGEYKYPRSINARNDTMKVLVGPVFKAVEKKLFGLPWFIKKTPRAQWPAYIRDRCGRLGVKCIATDYSSFESSFVPELMATVEMQLYDYMLSSIYEELEKDLFHSLLDLNVLENRGFLASVLGRRMSGEMNTSLGNGFSNLMFNLFVLEEKGCSDISGVIEGDDGLFVFQGPVPSSADYLSLGLEIKLDEHQYYNEASFCGVVFAEEVGDNLMNPYTVLGNTCWAGADYAQAKAKTLRDLQIAKALSTLAQLPGCPVVQSIALWQLRGAKYKAADKNRILQWVLQSKQTNYWSRLIYQETSESSIEPRPVAMASRELVARKYGMSIDTQLHLEKLFDESSSNVDLSCSEYLGPMQRTVWNTYVRVCHYSESNFLQPPGLGPNRPLEGLVRADYWIPSGNMRYRA
jgi:hypothetical protein